MTSIPRVRPTGGFYALRHDPKEPGDYDATPVVSWSDNGDGTASPLTIKDISATVILCPDQSVIEIDGGRVWASVPDWIVDVQGRGKSASKGVSRATPSLRDLGISGRACAPLERMGIKLLGDLQRSTKEDVAATKGVSTDTLAELIALMSRHGLAWKGETVSAEDESPDVDDDEDDDDDIM